MRFHAYLSKLANLVLLRLIVAAGASAAFDLPGYLKAAPAVPPTTTSWPSANATKSTYVYLHKDMALAKATPYYFGANLPIYIKNALLLSDDQTTKMRDAVTFLRYPGGSSANKYLWDGDFDTYPYFKTWSWMAATANFNMTQFVQVINSTGAVPLVELNAALALVYGYEVAAAYFLEQHEALLALGLNVTYYEFGNENYGGWGDGYADARTHRTDCCALSAPVPARRKRVSVRARGGGLAEPPYGDYPVNGSLYAAAFSAASSVLKAKYPYIKLGAVVQWSDSDGRRRLSRTGRSAATALQSGTRAEPQLGAFVKNWTADVLAGGGSSADFLIVH
eukprot:3110125-Prymnesium_polylepis.1